MVKVALSSWVPALCSADSRCRRPVAASCWSRRAQSIRGTRARGAVATDLDSVSSGGHIAPVAVLPAPISSFTGIELGLRYLQLPAAGEWVLPGSLLPDSTGLPPVQTVLDTLITFGRGPVEL